MKVKLTKPIIKFSQSTTPTKHWFLHRMLLTAVSLHGAETRLVWTRKRGSRTQMRSWSALRKHTTCSCHAIMDVFPI